MNAIVSAPENHILAAILRDVGSIPYVRLWRNNTGAAKSRRTGRLVRFGIAGQGDLSGIISARLPGGTIFGARLEIEVKSATGRQSPDQRAFQAMLERFGGCYVLARSVDDAIAGIRRYLEAIGAEGCQP